MMRQRIRSRTPSLAVAGHVVAILFAVALVWYGLMVVLLAIGLSADTVDTISGYRTVIDQLSSVTVADVDGGGTRGIVAGAGVLAFLVFGWLALKQLPRPYLARSSVELEDSGLGIVSVSPRALERAAEVAACSHPSVSSAAGRYGTDDLEVSVSVRRARELPATLRDVQERVRTALGEHGLPAVPVNVNLTGYERRQRRELN